MIAARSPIERARLVDVLGALDERERHPIGAELEPVFEVAAILRGQRRQRNDRVGDVDALAIGKLSADDHARHRKTLAAALDLEAELAVVEQELQTRRHHREDLGMRKAHALFAARRRIDVETQRRPRLQHHGAVHERSDAKLRSLQIHQHADRAVRLFLDRANRFHPLAVVRCGAMAEVQPKDVDAGVKQRVDQRQRRARRAERGDDLRVALTAHRFAALAERRGRAASHYFAGPEHDRAGDDDGDRALAAPRRAPVRAAAAASRPFRPPPCGTSAGPGIGPSARTAIWPST